MTDDDPLWYKDAIIYEAHVRAFHDSDGDGYGDFRGLTQKLDYLEDLGITVIWLLPFYPSPLKDDGYDIADYTSIHPQYGKLEDFQEFLQAAHDRKIRVIAELVVNHTSDQHPWFQRARMAPKGSVERDFYVWSDTAEEYKDARIIFKDYEPSNWSLDRVAGQYYWHRFYHHQPDLNFDNPAVWEALFPVLDFWMDMGLDGMRLDAIPYLYERDGTNCENLPETHVFLKALRKRMDEKYPGRMFLAEANQWPEDVLPYFGEGDECHMAFHFPLMPRLFMAVHQEDRFPILDILEQTPAIPENCQWCMFLRNHDELTLEMVTDEERDYMYRAYAEDRTARINLGIRRRLAPLLKNDRRRIELMNALLFSLPGTPVIYYGDEIGMGDNIYLGDRNGVRTPMQWSSDRNAGFSRANPQRLYLPIIIDPEYHYEAVNVEALHNNPSSLLWWMKRLIGLRKKFKAFGRGTLEFLRPANPKVLVFIRKHEDERILVVANLSRFVQFAEVDLREYAGVIPEEVFGRTPSPMIGEAPYLFTLGPHAFYWFSLPAPTPLVANALVDTPQLPALPGIRPISERFNLIHHDELEVLLPDYITRRRLARSMAPAHLASIQQTVRIGADELETWFLVVNAEFREGIPETISLALAFVPEDSYGGLMLPVAEAGFARVLGPIPGTLCDALAVPACCRAVLRSILGGRTRSMAGGELILAPIGPKLAPAELDALDSLPLSVLRDGPNSFVVVYGEGYILKPYHRIEEGPSPAIEIGRFLMERTNFTGFAPLAGFIDYSRRVGERATLDVLYRYVPHQSIAWQYTLDELSRYFERVAALSREAPPQPPEPAPLIGPAPRVSGNWLELSGGFGESARLLGRRTAAMHLALASGIAFPAFAPEPFSKLYQRSLYQGLRNLIGRVCRRLARMKSDLPEPIRDLAIQFLAIESDVARRFQGLRGESFEGQRIRIHGDYHLARLMFTGKDFVVTDFEGDPWRSLDDRRIKRSPLRDVASMIYSFDYAMQVALLGLTSRRGRAQGVIRDEDLRVLGPWAEAWYLQITREFVTSYLHEVADSDLIPRSEASRHELLELFMLETSLRQLYAELLAPSEKVAIPIRAALRVMRPVDVVHPFPIVATSS